MSHQPEKNKPIFFTNLAELKDSLDGNESQDRVFAVPKPAAISYNEPEWFTDEYEGQLNVDVYQTAEAIVVKSTIAGVKPEDLEIFVHNDLLTIRGKREHQEETTGADYFYKECYWGGFSRSIILPVEVQTDRITATFRNGILKITLPKKPSKDQVINVPISEM